MNPLLKLTSTLIICFFTCQTELYSQTYVYRQNDFTQGATIYEMNDDNSMSWVANLELTEPIYADIAVDPQGDVYGLAQAGGIHLIDLETGVSEQIGAFSDFSVHTAFVCDSEYNLYTLDVYYNLIAFNILTLEETLIMNVGDFSPGDLAFFHGDLVFPSANDGVSIKSIDMETSEVTIIYELPEEVVDLAAVWGCCNSFDSCGNEQIIASSTNGSYYKLDIENDTYEVLEVTYDIDEGGNVFGMASLDDVLSSDCDRPVVSVEEEELVMKDFLYPNPAQSFVNLSSPDKVHSIAILNMNGDHISTMYQPSSRIDLSNLACGFYMVRITLKDGRVKVEKLVLS